MGLLTRLRAASEESAGPAGRSPGIVKAYGAFGVGAGSPASPGLPALGSMPSSSGLLVSQATSLQVSTVYSCVRIRSRDLARCPPQILQGDGKGNKSQVLDHPLTALFRRPNRAQTWFEFAEQMHVAFLLRSNAYAVILRDWRANPTELIPVNPDLVTVMEAPDGSIFYNIARAGLWLAAVLQDAEIVIPAEDVLHVRDLTFNSLVGVSRIALARDAIGLAMIQEQQASRWAGNGARPAGVLQTKKQLSQDAAARLRQQWENMQAGIQNTGRTAILEDGLEWKAMALSSVDLEFVQARLTQVKEIARFWEIPLHKLGENESLPRASVAELNADYVQNVVMSDATRWEQKMAAAFNVGGTLEVKFDERGLLRADLATMINSARTGVMSGLITQNEGRNYIGYGPMDGGDRLLAPVNLAPNGSAIDGAAPDGAGRPPTGELPGAAKSAVARTADIAAIAKAVAAELRAFNADQPRDEHGRFAGGDDGEQNTDHETGREPEHAGDAAASESHAALSYEVKQIVKGVVVTAAAALAVALAPEATAVTVVAGFATTAADTMFQNAAISAARQIAKEMGFDASGIENAVSSVTSIFKSTDDPQHPKASEVLSSQLNTVLGHTRDELATKLKADHPAGDRLNAALTAIGASCTAAKAKLVNIDLADHEKHVGEKGFDPNQPRDAAGRFAGDATDDKPAGLSTRDKVHLAVATVGLLALGAALHQKVPYKINGGSWILDAKYRHQAQKNALQDLHDRSVHTPLTDAERASLVKYTTNQYALINKKLRLGHKTNDDIDNIDSALSKSLLADNTVVYRGVNLARSKRLLANNQPGDVFVDRGFPSTSLSEDVARDFAKTKDGAGTGSSTDPSKHGYVMSINVDKGSNVMPLTPGHTAHDNLVEMLLPRSSAFKVLDVDHASKTIFMQHVALGDGILGKVKSLKTRMAGTDDLDLDFERDGGDRFLVALDDELEHFAAPEGDTTAIDYAGYRPPQPPEPMSEYVPEQES